MNKSIISLLMLASVSAFANESGDEKVNRVASVGEHTRAEVRAALSQAQQEGVIGVHSQYAAQLQQPSRNSGAGRSRAETRAEAVQAARARVVHELL